MTDAGVPHTPGAGWARVKAELGDMVPDLTEEDERAVDALLAGAGQGATVNRELTVGLGWDKHGHAVKTGLPIDKHLGSGDLQDAENCGYAPVATLSQLGVDTAHGDMQIQFRDGRIVLLDGTVLERGGTLNCVWAVTRRPNYTEADVDKLAEVIFNARKRGIEHGNYTLARWILDHWKPGGTT